MKQLSQCHSKGHWRRDAVNLNPHVKQEPNITAQLNSNNNGYLERLTRPSPKHLHVL